MGLLRIAHAGFSCDIAHPVSPAGGEGRKRVSRDLTDRRLPTTKKTPPDRDGGMKLDREEMIRILEEIIRDPDTNATARCTAANKRLTAEQERPPGARFHQHPRIRGRTRGCAANRLLTGGSFLCRRGRPRPPRPHSR